MGELQRVEGLNQTHIGKVVRVQGVNGGYIEGTLASFEHRVTKPYGQYVRTFVYFEEFGEPVRGSESMKYYPFETVGNREATEVPE